jgi:hypothetical protein
MLKCDFDRCLTLWMHQNTLLWGRLQTISVLQVAVISGWYFLFTEEHFLWASLLAGLGTHLSYWIFQLICCDLDLRKKYRDELDNIAPGFLPNHNGIPGWKIIKKLGSTFCVLNWTMTVVSLVFLYFIFCPHCK